MNRFSATGLKRLAIGAATLALLAACEPADERAQEHYENGLKLAEAGDDARAALEFREALRLDDTMAPAYFAIAKMREKAGNLKAAVGNYQRTIELDENNAEARVRLGRIMLTAGQLDEALKYAMAAAQLAPNNTQALLLRATVGIQVENYDLAIESANAALAVEPVLPDAQLVLAAVSHRQGDLAATNARIDAALAQSPENLSLNLYKLRLVGAQEDKSEVPVILNRLTGLYPERPEFHSALIRWHVSQGELDKAETAVRAFAAALPNNADAALSVAQFMVNYRSPEAARAELNKLIKENRTPDNNFRYEMALVRLDFSTGNDEAAIAQLQQIIVKYGDTPNGDAATVQLATWRAENGEAEAARHLVDGVLKRDAGHADALALRAQLKIAGRDFDSAIQDIRAASSEDPENWRYLMIEARAHELKGATSLVGERLGAATQVSDYNPTPVLAYARHLRGTGKSDFAEGLIENALRRHPKNDGLLRALAQLKLERQDWNGAEEIAKQLRDTSENDQVADFVQAQSLAGRKEHDRSIELLEAIYQRNASSQSSMAALVSAYLRSGQSDRARAFLEDVLQSTPENPTALRLKGDLHAALGESEEAEAAYRKLVELNPEAANAYSALAQFLINQKRLDEAESTAKLGADATKVSSLKLTYAILLEQKGDYAGALNEYEELIKLQPNSFIVANNYASLLTDRFPSEANIQRAYDIARRLRESQVPQYQDTYGWLVYLRGEPEQALSYLRPAAEAMPNVMLAQFHLGMAYAKAGVGAEAVKALTRTLELAGDDTSSPQVKEAKATLEDLQKSAEK